MTDRARVLEQQAGVMFTAAAGAMKVGNELLRLATQARLRAEREALGSPFAGSRDPGALPGVLGSRSLRAAEQARLAKVLERPWSPHLRAVSP